MASLGPSPVATALASAQPRGDLAPAALLPAAALPPEALQSLRRAFAREVRLRLPRLLEAARQPGDADPARRADAGMLIEGARLLGDVAAARALDLLAGLLDSVDLERRCEAADTAALLLGRWSSAPQD